MLIVDTYWTSKYDFGECLFNTETISRQILPFSPECDSKFIKRIRFLVEERNVIDLVELIGAQIGPVPNFPLTNEGFEDYFGFCTILFKFDNVLDCGQIRGAIFGISTCQPFHPVFRDLDIQNSNETSDCIWFYSKTEPCQLIGYEEDEQKLLKCYIHALGLPFRPGVALYLP